MSAAEQAVRIGGRSMFSLGALGFAYAHVGNVEEARSILDEMETTAADRYVCPYDIAVIYAALGDRDAALYWLDQAVQMREHAMLFANVDPALICLNDDPHFQKKVAQVWGR